MRKQWWTAGAAFGIGAAMLLTSGYSAMANTSGYEAYKSAVKHTQSATSLTAKANWTVADNGTNVLEGTANVKLDRLSDASSIALTVNDGSRTQDFNMYRQDGKIILKSSDRDVYRVMEQDGRHSGGDWQGPPQAMEQVVDALMGHLKELATVESAPDGGKTASLHLSGGQIPAIVNALGSIAVSKHAEGYGWHSDEGNGEGIASPAVHALNVNLPKLTDGIQVNSVDLDATIRPDQSLAGQTAVISVQGTDNEGKRHVLVLRLNVDFSDLGRTAPDRIDLTGKPTEEMQSGWNNRSWHH
jgi:hypothetical protein